MAEKYSWEQLKRRVKIWFSERRKTTVLMIIGIVGIVLIGVSSVFGADKAEENDISVMTTDQYIVRLETRLEAMVSSIRGAGRSKVTVMLENGVEYVYADEEKRNTDRSQNDRGDISESDDNQRTVVTVDDGNGKNGLLITEIQPTVRGVVVACEGSADPATTAIIKQAITTALDITDQRVCVIPYNTEGV